MSNTPDTAPEINAATTMAELLAAFPGARIAAIKTAEEAAQEAQAEALPEVEDEWDPFEE